MKNPTILYLDHFNRHGGAQEYILELAREVRSLGCECAINRPQVESLVRLATTLPSTGFTLLSHSYKSPGFYLRMPQDMVRLRNSIKRLCPDLIHCNSIPSLILARACARKTPIVFTCHDYLTQPLRIRLLDRCSTAIIAVSPGVEAWLRRMAVRTDIVAIPNGFPDYAQNLPARQSGGERLRIGMVGRLENWKGCDLFIQAVSTLRHEHVDADFCFVGSGEDADYLSHLHRLAANAGIRFLPFQSDKGSLYRNLDVVVNASIEPEPFGRTLVEAMIFGCMAVGPDEAGPAEIIAHGTTGFLFEPRNPDALASCLKTVIGMEPAARVHLLKNARESFLARFSLQAVARRVLEEVYRPLMEKSQWR